MMALSKRTSALVAAVIIMAVIGAAIVSVWASKPAVEYSMSGYAYIPNTYSFNPYGVIYTTTMPDTYTLVNSNTPLLVALHWENKGNIDVPLQLILSVQNANITWFSNYGSNNFTEPMWGSILNGQEYNGTTATFTAEAKANSTQYKRFNILPVGNAQTFTVTYKLTDPSNAFSLIPVGQTTATYKQTNENLYH